MTPTELRVFRAKYNLTQDQLSKKLGVTAQTISNYENGSPIPPIFELAIKHLETTYDTSSVEGRQALN